jgi:hypothetical protein
MLRRSRLRSLPLLRCCVFCSLLSPVLKTKPTETEYAMNLGQSARPAPIFVPCFFWCPSGSGLRPHRLRDKKMEIAKKNEDE